MSDQPTIKANELAGQHVLLGVTGGIAAYKSADLVRRFRDAGAEVRVVMTSGAQAFVRPLTFQAVSSNPVHTELLDESAEAGMGHIELARWADRIVIAPASADFIARLAHGLAPDLLSTICLASAAPIAIAPAMNQQMWASKATRDNCHILLERDVQILGPGEGSQACGDIGPGRMLEPEDIVSALGAVQDAVLAGRRILITAGPTYEDVDPVRFIGNRSSGKMGFALAKAARRAGASVTLIAGPTDLAIPEGVNRVDVRSAAQMREAVMQNVARADVFISVAAVSDYTPARPSGSKLKKGLSRQKIELVATADILSEVAAMKERPYTVGFAAETDRVMDYAREKLLRKRLDMIAANRVGQPGTGFGGDHNEITLLRRNEAGDAVAPDGETDLGAGTKDHLARRIIQEIASDLHRRESIEDGSDQGTRPASG